MLDWLHIDAPLLGLALIVVLGVGAQWASWRLRVPSILFLLILGILAGPVSRMLHPEGTPLLNPDQLFGSSLVPLVELSVALILYEGGLTLRLREIATVRGIVTRLVTLGALVTLGIAAIGAHYILGLSWALSLLLGSILIVTGPTVIGPLLAHIRPVGRVAAILKWESIVIDPIGVMITVLVFEVITSLETETADGSAFMLGARVIFVTLLAGTVVGVAMAMLLIAVLRRYLAPDYLQNPISLLLVIAAMALSDLAQEKSGLLAVTVMGAVLANQSSADVRRIIEFKENLRVLLISALFIVLGARLEPEALNAVGIDSLLFVVLVIAVVRPLGVLASTLGTDLAFRERVFLCFMAPRGIVAAAVASVLGLALVSNGNEEAEALVPITFLVILATVAFYSVTAGLVAKRLDLTDQNPQGVMIIGAHPWARALAESLHNRKIKVRLVDSNRENVRAARMAHLPTYTGNILAEKAMDELDLTGMGRMLALTPNDEVNALAAQRFGETFGRAEVYQLAARPAGAKDPTLAKHLQGRTLFADDATYADLAQRFATGSIVKSTTLSDAFTYDDYRMLYGQRALVLFVVSESGTVAIATNERTPDPLPGQTLIALVNPDELLLG